MKRPRFEEMSLFQLMNFVEENNYSNETGDCIVYELPDEWSPFENKPDNYIGTTDEYYKELDSFEDIVKKEYLEICKKIYIAILDENRLE